ncbi:MAG TPA: O-antigen ligase family protein, partial [Candidatus Goldiibacteriota bacterium]|nr:O-antigen ligase family protein [Candidatus Goldiibacteriota bacterium]
MTWSKKVLKSDVKTTNLHCFLLFFLFVAVTISFSPEDYNFILIKEIILITGTAAFLPLFLFKSDFKIKKIVFYPAMLTLWFIVSFIFSDFKNVCLPAMLMSITCLIFLFLIMHSDFDDVKTSDVIILSFIPALFIGLLQIFFPDRMKVFMAFGNRIPSTFGNPNFFGAYLSAVIPFVISRFFNSKETFYKLFLFVVFVISFILIFFTGSKSSLLALAIGILMLFVLNLKNLKGRKILMTLLVIFVIFAGLFLKRNSESLKESLFFRNYVWRGTINVMLNNPVTGTGLGSFAVVFPKYRPYELMKWTYEHNYEVHYPENIFLQIGSETGIIGLLLFIFVLSLIFKSGRSSSPEYSAGFAAMLTTNFFGVDVNYAPSMMLFVVISGVMMKNDKDYFSVNPLYARLISIFVLTFLAFVSAFWVNRHVSGIYTKRGVYFSKSGDFKTAIENYKTALKFYDKNTEALYFMGSSYYDSGNPEDALKIFRHLEKSAPDYVLLHYKIAKIYNDTGLYDDAIKEYKKMLKIDPYLKEALVELAYIYYNKKNMFDEA